LVIWLVSYPKSGNTWVRSFLTNYFSGSSEFNFDQLDKIERFPTPELMDQLKINFHNLSEIVSNWIRMQEFINLKNDTTYLKTHNAMCTVNNHPFTNKENTAGFIYLVRDPRDVILSYSKHLNIDLNETFEIMNDSMSKEAFDRVGGETVEVILGSWSDHYKSWKNFNSAKGLIIKYEDLVLNPNVYLRKIIFYLNQLNGLIIDEEKITKSIENTNFLKMQKLEKKTGFKESTRGPFFRKGKVGDWKNELNDELKIKIEKAFFKEMKELNYL